MKDYQDFLNRFGNVKSVGQNQYRASCPVCENGQADGKHLYISFEDNKALIHCKHGDDPNDIMRAIGENSSFMFINDNIIARNQPTEVKNERKKKQSTFTLDFIKTQYKPFKGKRAFNGDFSRYHEYANRNGKLVGLKAIWKSKNGEKAVSWFTPKTDGRFVIGLGSEKMPLYGLKRVLEEKDTVYITEGEKDADTVIRMGYTATTSPNGAGSKWNPSYNNSLKGKNIVILEDNDEAGKAHALDIANKVYFTAKSVKIINPVNIYSSSREKDDITDIVEKIGLERAKIKLDKAVETTEFYNYDSELPNWVVSRYDKFGGFKSHDINEEIFINVFLNMYGLRFIGSKFYDKEGNQVQEGRLKKQIQDKISKFITKDLAKRTCQLYQALEHHCYTEPPTVEENRICCKNTDLLIDLKTGEITPTNKKFVLSRLGITYKEDAKRAEKWEKFLNDLLYEEDILTLQEYMGYCLIPTTKAQVALFLIGRGGEGKSRIGYILREIFQNRFISDKIHKLEDDRFLSARLEDKLIFYDDDLNTKKLRETGTFKQLITNEIEVEIEPKGKEKRPVQLFTRFVSCGNMALSSCFDKTDGFYRRLLILNCKEKDREKDDRNLNEKLKGELDEIFNWCLIGLQRLVRNDFNFTASDRAKEAVEDLRNEDNNLIEFFEDTSVFEYKKDAETTTKDIQTVYKIWCDKNGYQCLSDNTLYFYLKSNQKKLKIKYKNRIKSKRVRGYEGIGLTLPTEDELQSYYDQEPRFRYR